MNTLIRTDIYLEGLLYLSRRLPCIPQQGHFIYFRGLIMKVNRVEWHMEKHESGDEYFVRLFCGKS
jgi:hypothetical protein